jgi:class 3 adenylate cyclase
VRVRIGVHTGEPIRTAAGYTGLDVVRGARLKEAGHGGQVLLSKSTAALIEDALIGGLSLRDLGIHRLKGVPRPERVVTAGGGVTASSSSSSRTCRPTSRPCRRWIRADARV